MSLSATAKRDSAFSNAKPYHRACRRHDNPMPVNDSEPALRGSAFLYCEAKPQVASEARDNNANFAWVQHFIHHLAPQRMAGFVLANGDISSNQPGEGDIAGFSLN